MNFDLQCPNCGAVYSFLYKDPQEELPCDTCQHTNPLYLWNPVEEAWVKDPPIKPAWYWTRTTDGWYPNTILPGEVKSNGDTHTPWGDHDVEWYTMPLPLPEGYISHK